MQKTRPDPDLLHEGVLGFLDQFVVTEPENITSED